MSYSFDAPLPDSYYPSSSIEGSLEYRPTNIQDNVAPLFDEDLYRPQDIPSLDLGWEGHYWPSPTLPNSEYAFFSECVSQDLCHAAGPDTQLGPDSARIEYSPGLGDYNATPSHLSRTMPAKQPSGIEMSILSPISDGSCSSEASGADIDAYGETDSEYGGGSTLGSDCIINGEDDEYLPSSSSRGSKRARPSIAHTRARRVSQVACRTRHSRTSPYTPPRTVANASSHVGVAYPTPPYVFTPTRSEQAPPGTPRSLPQSAMKCPVCSYRPSKSRFSDLRRHYESHFVEDSRKYVCCGVCIDRVEGYSAAAAVEGDVYLHEGELRVGQCWRVFGRKDALQRHLLLSPDCICDAVPDEDSAKNAEV